MCIPYEGAGLEEGGEEVRVLLGGIKSCATFDVESMSRNLIGLEVGGDRFCRSDLWL